MSESITDRIAEQFQSGDEVFGDLCECGFGTFAEYVYAPESALALKPGNMTFEQTAGVPQEALLALQSFRDKADIPTRPEHSDQRRWRWRRYIRPADTEALWSKGDGC